MLGPLLFILHTSEMFELVENRLYAHDGDSTLLAVVRKPADRPAVAASFNRDLAFTGTWGSAAECHLQLLECQVHSVASLCPNQTFLSLCHRRHVAALFMLYKVNSNSNHSLFSDLPSASVRVRHT